MAYGSINLAVKAGTVKRGTEFLVVDRPASYNVIMGTPCVPSHQRTIFAWATEDMPGIDINITCHELKIDTTFKPVKQKKAKART